MGKWLRELDRVLRGDATRPDDLRGGTVAVSARRLAAVSILLGVTYGLCMGVFGVFNRETPEYRLLANGMLKVPSLFLLTLCVTFPSLYVFNALVGSRLTALSLGRLLAAALGVTLAVLASFGPIVAFFSVTTANYPFILLLNVAVFAIAGLLGMGFLLRTLYRLSAAMRPSAPPTLAGEPAPLARPPEPNADGRVKIVFAIWLLVFGLVGAQMSWVLRPFIGSPDTPFTWFRPRMSSFFEAVFHALRRLLTE
jgi:hypothetical protein